MPIDWRTKREWQIGLKNKPIYSALLVGRCDIEQIVRAKYIVRHYSMSNGIEHSCLLLHNVRDSVFREVGNLVSYQNQCGPRVGKMVYASHRTVLQHMERWLTHTPHTNTYIRSAAFAWAQSIVHLSSHYSSAIIDKAERRQQYTKPTSQCYTYFYMFFFDSTYVCSVQVISMYNYYCRKCGTIQHSTNNSDFSAHFGMIELSLVDAGQNQWILC